MKTIKAPGLVATNLLRWWPVLLLFLGSIILFFSLRFRGGWIEPDTYAFFNRACLNGLEFNTPILSKLFFDVIPCNLISWFGVQSIILFFSLLLLAYGLKIWNIPLKGIGLFFLSGFTIFSLMSFEDDHLALPFVFIISWWLLKKPSLKRFILTGIITLFLWQFVWEGAIFPLALILLMSIKPILGLLGVAYTFLSGHLNSDTGSSAELVWGNGFGGNFLVFILAIFSKDVSKKFQENRDLLIISGIMILVSFFHPKWGIYAMIPMVPLAWRFFEDQPKFLNKLCKMGFILFLIGMPIGLALKPPVQAHWDVIQTAKAYQDRGEIVLNDWGMGRYFQFVGGKPSAAGGFHGKQNIPDSPWYWLGRPLDDCITLQNADLVHFQRCG